MRKELNLIASLLVMAVVGLAGCSALSGLTGGTTNTPQNPTGELVTVKTTKMSVSLPSHSDVAANCAKGDTNSCQQLTTYTAFCQTNKAVAEIGPVCADAGYPIF